LLRIRWAQGHDEAPSWFQLLEQRSWHRLGGRGNHDFVVRGMLGPAPRSVPDPNVDIGIAEVVKTCLRAIGQFLNDLDAPDLTCKFG
jgi:hypothetical protein